MRVASYFACGLLSLLALGFSFLAVVATGGDSAFADRSSWIYAPWVVALTLTLAAIIASATGHVASGVALIAGAGSAYAATWFIWGVNRP